MTKLTTPMINAIRELAAPGSVAKYYQIKSGTLTALINRGLVTAGTTHTLTADGYLEAARLGVEIPVGATINAAPVEPVLNGMTGGQSTAGAQSRNWLLSHGRSMRPGPALFARYVARDEAEAYDMNGVPRVPLGERSTVHLNEADRPGWGTSRTWRRTINGKHYSFTVVNMPDGELRMTVRLYNGYGNDDVTLFGMSQAEADERGMRWACAWNLVKSITIKPPALPKGPEVGTYVEAKGAGYDTYGHDGTMLVLSEPHTIATTGRDGIVRPSVPVVAVEYAYPHPAVVGSFEVQLHMLTPAKAPSVQHFLLPAEQMEIIAQTEADYFDELHTAAVAAGLTNTTLENTGGGILVFMIHGVGRSVGIDLETIVTYDFLNEDEPDAQWYEIARDREPAGIIADAIEALIEAEIEARTHWCPCGQREGLHAAHWSSPTSARIVTWSCTEAHANLIDALRVDGILDRSRVDDLRELMFAATWAEAHEMNRA